MIPEWSEYILQSKRSHMLMPTSNGHIFASYPPLFDYSAGQPLHSETFSNLIEKVLIHIIEKNDFVFMHFDL